ncbi:MAG: hypothetical protein GY904_21430 [Planctomycetaceae bacterium]|nr:hypothetical protein [Planctomycetaceae bacterium]
MNHIPGETSPLVWVREFSRVRNAILLLKRFTLRENLAAGGDKKNWSERADEL